MKNIINFVIFLLLTCSGIFAQTVERVQSISMTVSSLDEIVPFYEEVLNFKKVEEYEQSGDDLQRLLGLRDDDLSAKVAVLQLGQEQIELIEYLNEDQKRPIPVDSRSNDLWFQHIAIVVSDMEQAYEKLWQHKVTHVSTAPQTLPDYIPAAAGISAFYFRDPDGHNLELIHFPKGKGNPKWQGQSDLFLGIDHTAIGIADTESSQTFYETVLGLKVAGNSENYGTEQEHLNQVFGARLWITGLVAKEGFGVEFLDYIAPPGGRTYPKNSLPTDLWHWHTSLEVEDINAIFETIQQYNYKLISNGLSKWRSKDAFLVRDPDGHAVLIME